MKTIALYVVATIIALAVMFSLIYGVRLFSNATTPLTLHTPKPGITCAAMVTGDGAALSCWKD